MEDVLKDILNELKWQSRVLQKILDNHRGRSKDGDKAMKIMLENLSQLSNMVPQGTAAGETLKNTLTMLKEKTDGY